MAFPLPTPSPSYSLLPVDASILSKFLWTYSQVFQGKSLSEFIYGHYQSFLLFVFHSYSLSLYFRMLVVPLTGSALSVALLPLQCVLSLNSSSIFVVVQSLSHVRLFATPWTAAHQASLSFTIYWSFLKLISIESMMPSNHLILCSPLLSCLQSFPASFPMSQLFT